MTSESYISNPEEDIIKWKSDIHKRIALSISIIENLISIIKLEFTDVDTRNMGRFIIETLSKYDQFIILVYGGERDMIITEYNYNILWTQSKNPTHHDPHLIKNILDALFLKSISYLETLDFLKYDILTNNDIRHQIDCITLVKDNNRAIQFIKSRIGG